MKSLKIKNFFFCVLFLFFFCVPRYLLFFRIFSFFCFFKKRRTHCSTFSYYHLCWVEVKRWNVSQNRFFSFFFRLFRFAESISIMLIERFQKKGKENDVIWLSALFFFSVSYSALQFSSLYKRIYSRIL